jgi:hypothetical protein
MPKPTPTQEENNLAMYGLVVMNKEEDGSTDNPPGPVPDPSEPPVLLSLSPNTVASGDPDFVLHCRGANFGAASVIHFGSEDNQDEPTTLVSSTEVTTGVKPRLFDPAVVPVTVRHGGQSSAAVNFTFTEPVSTKTKRST